MKYQLNQKPPLLAMLLYGLQWWIVALPCVIIMGAVVSKIHYNDVAMQTLYMQKIFAVMGITTIAQVLWGHRLPLVIGPASVLLVGILASLSAGVSVIYTSIVVGGVFLTVLAFSGLLTKIRFIFTSRVVTVILILIPFTLMPTIIKLIFGNEYSVFFNLIFAFALVIVLLFLNRWLRGVWKSTVIIWGLVLGTFCYYAMHGLPQVESVNFSKELLTEGFLISPTFDAGTIIAFIFCFVALLINELGSIEAVGEILKADRMELRIKKGVGFAGISNIFSGAMGTIGSVDFSMSTGIIAATGCASRYTLIPAGVGLFLCSLFPSLVNLLNHIPTIVMGTLLLYLMATQLSSGLMLMIREKAVDTFDQGVIIGLSLMVAILITFMPEAALNQMPSIVRPIVGNGFVMGVITVLLLEHIILKQKKA